MFKIIIILITLLFIACGGPPPARSTPAPTVAAQPARPAPAPIVTAQAPTATAQASATPAASPVRPPVAPTRAQIAVYVTGGATAGENEVLGARITDALVNSGRYRTIERSEAFLSQIGREHVVQRGGAIDDSQIRELGRQFGAQFVCIARIAEAFGGHQIAARIVDVENAEVVASGTAEGSLRSMHDLITLSNQVVGTMLGISVTPPPPPTPSQPVPSASAPTVTPVQPQTPVPQASVGGRDFRETANGLNIDMVFVRGGTFTMGCTPEQGDDCRNDERPARSATSFNDDKYSNYSVTLSDFYIGKFPVTQRQWVAVTGNNPSHFKGADLPVENVSWNDLRDFLLELRSMTGRNYRLLTEAEWEYAARGGSQSRGNKYAGSNIVDRVAWHSGNSGGRTHPVGTKAANELGIHDMSGNVWEWVSDWYGTYPSGAQTNPTGPTSGSSRVYRGGSWYFVARYCRVSNRVSDSPGIRNHRLGFRLAVSP